MASIINASSSGSGGIVQTADASGVLQLQSNGTVALTVSGATVTLAGATTLSSTLQVATTIGVGGATPAASGAGITFPATQSASSDANTLDDYEEGSFTPAIKCTSANGTVVYNYQYGYYVKIGQLVWVYFDMQINSYSGASGAPYIDLPFINANLAQNYSSFLPWDVYQTFTGTNVQACGYMTTNGIDMRLLKYSGTSSEVGAGFNINVIGRISGVITYRTAS